LRGSLSGETGDREDVAARLGMTPEAVKVAVHRLRKRYRARLRAAIAATVSDPAEVDDEMRHSARSLEAAGPEGKTASLASGGELPHDGLNRRSTLRVHARVMWRHQT
jgi:hypothetical protein